MVLEKKIFKFVNVFSLFFNYLPLEKGGDLHLKKLLNPLYPRMHCANFGWNWPCGSGEDDLSNSLMYFRYIVIALYLLLEKGGVALYLNKLESPSSKNALCQVWLKLARWFWRRRWKCEKFTTTTTTTLTWTFGSDELKKREETMEKRQKKRE